MRRSLLIIFLSFSTYLFGQPEITSSTIKILERSPSPPNTASLGKYFDVPVNYATGVPNIQIPLLTIKTGNISIPISIAFHGGGIKVNTTGGIVGLGWDLNCGGVITKQVNGQDDFFASTQFPSGANHPFYNYLDPDYTIDTDLGFNSMSDVVDSMQSGYALTHGNDLYRLMGRIVLNQYDGESDEYHFTTPDESGTIFFNQKLSAFLMNKINGWKVAFDDTNDEWTLKGKSGLHYNFAAKEITLFPFYGVPINPYAVPSSYYYTSAWYLSTISDVANNKSVSFTYDTSARKYNGGGQSRYENYLISSGASYNGGNTTMYDRVGTERIINRIDFNEGWIEFVRDTASRLDYGPKSLKHIKLFDKSGTLKKQFNLMYFYAWTASQATSRLFLKSIQEVDFNSSSSTESKPYNFSYDTTAAMPAPFSFAQDKWGYNNGKTGNTTVIPTEVETYLMGLPTFANRWVDTNFTKSGIIKQIVYPTGGTLNFVFENNKDDSDSLIGGLRIKRITNFDSLANKELRTEYRYNDDQGHSTGVVQYRPTFHYTFGMSEPLAPNVKVTGESIYPLFSNQGSPIAYQRVERIDIDDTIELKTRHYYSNYLGYGIDVPTTLTYQNAIGVPHNKYPNFSAFNHLLYKTEVFKKVGGQQTLIKKDSLGYKTLNQFKSSVWNAQAAWINSDVFVEWPGNDPYASNPMNSIPSVNAYKMFQESLVNDVTATKVYESGITLEDITFKKYDSTNGNIKLVTSITSKGDTARVYYAYPIDFNYTTSSDPTNEEINELIDYNAIGTPIEIINTIKNPGGSEYVTGADLYIYDNRRLKKHLKVFETGLLFSSFTKAFNNNTAFYNDSRYVTESEVIAFDNNSNPKEINFRTKTQALIWDGEDLLSTVVNSIASDVAATSFETSAKGQWLFSGVPVTDTTAITGTKAYTLSNGNISDSSLNSTKSYWVTYWSKNGAQSVNGASSTAGRTVGDWTFYQHKVVNPTSGIITVSGTGTIDELRVYPVGSLMNTYTYKPLLGIWSQCDHQNKITYYNYDGFGRLSVVKDLDKNVIKVISYKLQQTQNQ